MEFNEEQHALVATKNIETEGVTTEEQIWMPCNDPYNFVTFLEICNYSKTL